MDLSQLGPHLTPILTIAILVSAIKPFLEQNLKPGDRLHDATIRLLALALGLAGLATDYLIHAAPPTAAGLERALGGGLLAGVGAILTYHLVAGDVFSSPPAEPSTRPVQAPAGPANG
jgi:hypothetical protein